MSPVRVVLVDDHALMREGIRTILSVHPDLEVIGQAGTGEDGVTLVREVTPDVVCMDVEMPGMGGLEATRQLVADPDVHARVLILTTFEREDYLVRALEAGASGFLLKNSRPEVLADGIRAVAAGEALLSPEVTRAVIERAVRAGALAATPGASPSVAAAPEGRPRATPSAVGLLTERELDVLRLLAAGMSNEEIADELFVGRATVKTHVSNVLMKLGLRDRVQAVVYAYRHHLVAP